MDTKNNTPTFRNTEDAFREAIASGRLCEDPAADHYAGDYMYMGTDKGVDLFKHSTTRQYLPAPVKAAKGWDVAGAIALPCLLPALLLGLLASNVMAGPKISTKATACLENRPASDSAQYVRLVDAEGKKHRFQAFILGDGTDTEFANFAHSRRVVALDDGMVLTVKQGKDEHGDDMMANMGEIGRCAPSKRAAFPKL